jgi:GAF domain-containing protein
MANLFRRNESTALPASLDNLSEDLKALLRLVARPDDPKRTEYLDFACKLTRSDTCAALVWLYDAGRKGYILDRFFPLPEGFVPPLEHIFAPADSARSSDAALPGWEGRLENHPSVQDWCLKQGFGVIEQIFPLRAHDTDSQPIGIVQFISSSPIPSGRVFLIERLVDALAGVIARSRDNRLLRTSDKMRTAFMDPDRSTDTWLSLAATTLADMTYAQSCVVFKQQRDLRFEVVTGIPKGIETNNLVAGAQSLTSHIAQHPRTVRISNFHDDDERLQVFQTTDFDQDLVERYEAVVGTPLRSLMAAPVLIGEHAIAVIMLINKQKHLAKQFSDTDEKILQSVCDDLGKAIPSVETFESMKRISGTRLSPDLSKAENCQRVFSLLCEILPGTVAAALFLKSPDLLDPEIRPLGGEKSWFTINHETVAKFTGLLTLGPVKGHPKSMSRFLLVLVLPGLDGEAGRLLIGLHRNYVSDFENVVLSFLCAELGNLLWAE